MKRRHALSLLGSACVGGCVGNSSGDSAATTTPERAVPDAEDCPSFDADVKRVVCSPDADASLTIDPAEQSGSLPRAEFDFALTNGTDTTFMVNFYNWSVWKHVAGDWFRIAPRFVNQPLMSVPPGDAHEWHLTVDDSDLDRPIPHASGTRDVTVVGLGPGTYAFGTDGWFEGQDYENGTGVAARFELTGDPLELTPVGIDRTERNGDTVVAYDDPEENEDPAKYVVTRVENSPEDSRQMITEQVLREAQLRNALALFEPGVRRVRLETGTTAHPAFGVREPHYVEYEGETYEIETERRDAETTDP